MTFVKEIIGHQNVKNHLLDLAFQNKMSQTSLFYGNEGIGKKQVALHLAQKILCSQNDHQPCLKCENCILFEKQNHPDFYYIAPEKQKLKNEQFSTVREKINFKPMLATAQVVVIDDADKMTKTTANSLLKILEEPRSQKYFILISSNLHKILMTIRSRAQKYHFQSLSATDCKTILEKEFQLTNFNPSQFDFYYNCFLGSPSLIAKAFQFDFDFQKILQLKQKKDAVFIMKFVADFLKSDCELSFFLQMLKAYCLQILKQQEDQNWIQIGFLDKIDTALTYEKRHIQKALILENLLL